MGASRERNEPGKDRVHGNGLDTEKYSHAHIDSGEREARQLSRLK